MLTCASSEIATKRFKDEVQLQWETDRYAEAVGRVRHGQSGNLVHAPVCKKGGRRDALIIPCHATSLTPMPQQKRKWIGDGFIHGIGAVRLSAGSLSFIALPSGHTISTKTTKKRGV
jgi:hypothetical protein